MTTTIHNKIIIICFPILVMSAHQRWGCRGGSCYKQYEALSTEPDRGPAVGTAFVCLMLLGAPHPGLGMIQNTSFFSFFIFGVFYRVILCVCQSLEFFFKICIIAQSPLHPPPPALGISQIRSEQPVLRACITGSPVICTCISVTKYC